MSDTRIHSMLFDKPISKEDKLKKALNEIAILEGQYAKNPSVFVNEYIYCLYECGSLLRQTDLSEEARSYLDTAKKIAPDNHLLMTSILAELQMCDENELLQNYKP